ncbi:MAG: sodium:proton antiporter [Bacteroidales bacterium]|nr:sodium:proton antiporter [Bacteroidales bacterium]
MYYSFILLLAISTFFTIINRKYLKLPATIGILILGMLLSISILGFKFISEETYNSIPHILRHINFHDFLMNIILGFLLFAGAMNIDFKALKKEKWSIFLFAVLGTLISTTLIGFSTHFIFGLMSIHIPLSYCLLFGALISPTDPIAVLAIFKNYKISKSLSIKIEGESLFNDGVGIVIFITILSFIQGDHQGFELKETLVLFLREAVGGILFGIILGNISTFLLRQTNEDPKTGVMVTLVLVTGGWTIADMLEVSAALAMVAAGITVGIWLHKSAGEKLHHLIKVFWEILDEIFNNMLFVLMGLAIILIDSEVLNISMAIITILIVLTSRFISVAIPYSLIRNKVPSERKNKTKVVAMLTWSGLRGALAFALALSLESMPYGHIIIFLTYSVAGFSIIVQGLTIGKLVKWLGF